MIRRYIIVLCCLTSTTFSSSFVRNKHLFLTAFKALTSAGLPKELALKIITHTEDGTSGQKMMKAFKAGNNPLAQELYKEEPRTADGIVDLDNNTILTLAARQGNFSFVIFLINNGAQVNQKGFEAATAFHEAVLHKHNDIARYLANKGADIQACDETGKTPLVYAINSSNQPMLMWLLYHNVNTHQQDSFGRTPLNYAQLARNEQAQRLLSGQGMLGLPDIFRSRYGAYFNR